MRVFARRPPRVCWTQLLTFSSIQQNQLVVLLLPLIRVLQQYWVYLLLYNYRKNHMRYRMVPDEIKTRACLGRVQIQRRNLYNSLSQASWRNVRHCVKFYSGVVCCKKVKILNVRNSFFLWPFNFKFNTENAIFCHKNNESCTAQNICTPCTTIFYE